MARTRDVRVTIAPECTRRARNRTMLVENSVFPDTPLGRIVAIHLLEWNRKKIVLTVTRILLLLLLLLPMGK
uniref:Ribosomal protein L33 n=1 Tax=Selaginella moellendorffii TaxID=88036 RepID=F4YZG4_SELML|nr:ribosomal protein L33 [Selaginella moellendorffii]